MKRTVKLGTILILLIILCGCGKYKHHVHPHPWYLPDSTILKFNVSQPVALRNISASAPGTEEVVGGFGGWSVIGNLYEFTESTISITKNALEKKNIKIDDKADKVLAVAVISANCGRDTFTMPSLFATTTLRVRLGNGLEKEYICLERYAHAYTTNSGFEASMPKCVEQMLSDGDVIKYLEQ
jgi:hypothetical protein